MKKDRLSMVKRWKGSGPGDAAGSLQQQQQQQQQQGDKCYAWHVLVGCEGTLEHCEKVEQQGAR
jgi:hypothetical protein